MPGRKDAVGSMPRVSLIFCKPLTANGAPFHHATVGQGAIIASFPPSDQLAAGALFIRELIPPAMGQGFLSAFGECLAIDTGDGLDDIHKLIILSPPRRGNRIPGTSPRGVVCKI